MAAGIEMLGYAARVAAEKRRTPGTISRPGCSTRRSTGTA